MANKKTPAVEVIQEYIEDLSTESQIELKEFIEKILESKKAQAKAEYELINGVKKQGDYIPIDPKIVKTL